MGYKRHCLDCRTYHYGVEKCFPRFLIREDGYHGDDDYTVIRARSIEKAVEEYCERDDFESAEYTIIKNGGTEDISASPDVDPPQWTKFSVTAETIASYTAHQQGE